MNRQELLLVQLSEECSEVAQNISKALRFGTDEVYHKLTLTNSQRVTQEMQDLIAVFELLVEEDILPGLNLYKITEKKIKVEKYLQYSKELGILK